MFNEIDACAATGRVKWLQSTLFVTHESAISLAVLEECCSSYLITLTTPAMGVGTLAVTYLFFAQSLVVDCS